MFGLSAQGERRVSGPGEEELNFMSATRGTMQHPLPVSAVRAHDCSEVTSRRMVFCSFRGAKTLILAVFVLVIAVGLAGCQQEAARVQNLPRPVQVEAVTVTDYAPTVRLTGEIRARFESDLAFRIEGRVSERMVNVGDHVNADQVLARLDPQQQEASVTAADANMRAAEAALRDATRTYERQKALLAKGFTTIREHDQAEETYLKARASLDNAGAQLGTARDHLSDTVLRAGVAGIITARKVETGQVVQSAQTAFTIAQDGPRDAVFNVNELIFAQEPADPAIRLTLVSDPAMKAKGSVREISPIMDTSNGTVTVKVAIEHPPAGMTLGASVVGEGRFRSRNLVVVPWSAVSSANRQPAVWTVNPQTKRLSLRPIAIEGYEREKVVVREGLQPGEIVVTGGAQFMWPQQAVAFTDGAAS
jgi:RND family efflux transporter MFP subunit